MRNDYKIIICCVLLLTIVGCNKKTESDIEAPTITETETNVESSLKEEDESYNYGNISGFYYFESDPIKKPNGEEYRDVYALTLNSDGTFIYGGSIDNKPAIEKGTYSISDKELLLEYQSEYDSLGNLVPLNVKESLDILSFTELKDNHPPTEGVDSLILQRSDMYDMSGLFIYHTAPISNGDFSYIDSYELALYGDGTFVYGGTIAGSPSIEKGGYTIQEDVITLNYTSRYDSTGAIIPINIKERLYITSNSTIVDKHPISPGLNELTLVKAPTREYYNYLFTIQETVEDLSESHEDYQMQNQQIYNQSASAPASHSYADVPQQQEATVEEYAPEQSSNSTELISIEGMKQIVYNDLFDSYNPNPEYVGLSDNCVLQDAYRNGYTFKGWYADDSLVTSFTADDSDPLILRAVWEPIHYSISYYDPTFGITTSNPQEYTIEQQIVLGSLQSEEKAFAGWYDEMTGGKVETIGPGATGNLVLTAKWRDETEEYNIYYENTKGALNCNPSTYRSDSGIIYLDGLTQNGYTFAGWRNQGELVTSIDTNGLSNDIYLSATWNPIEYNITYYFNSGTNHNPDKYSAESGDIVLQDLTGVGSDYVFDYWTMNGRPISKIPAGTTGDLYLNASISRKPSQNGTVIVGGGGSSNSGTQSPASSSSNANKVLYSGSSTGSCGGGRKYAIDWTMVGNTVSGTITIINPLKVDSSTVAVSCNDQSKAINCGTYKNGIASTTFSFSNVKNTSKPTVKVYGE